MGSNAKPVRLRAYVDNMKNKVMFAEAGEDFVEILCSFLTLPLGTIAKLTSNHADFKHLKVGVGSLTSLYESIVNLDDKRFSNDRCKDALVNPVNSSVSLCQQMKVNLNNANSCGVGGNGHPVILQRKGSFIVTDDLNITPFFLDKFMELLNSLGVKHIDSLDLITLDLGLEEFSKLLKWSVLTDNPMTSLIFGEVHKSYSSCIKNSTFDSSPGNSAQPNQKVKLLVQKSKNKVLCAQVDNSFLELLCSFLTIPLGAVSRLTKNGPISISNLYKSILGLDDGKYLKSNEVKNKLVGPKLASNYQRVTDLLPIYEENAIKGNFLDEQSTFIVCDDLEVALSPPVSAIFKFALGIPVDDMVAMEVSIGAQEALLILGASITSTSPLTDCLIA